jgi:demethylspheroidene O-methyltransferase
MADLPLERPLRPNEVRRPGLLTRLALSPRFHALVERIPFLRRHARAEGRALFSVISGFVQSQVLLALVELRVLHLLAEGPAPAESLAARCRVTPARLAVLLQAGAALGLLRQRRGFWHLTPRGGAFLAVPGLEAMVSHHAVLYRDLGDPAAFFRGETTPELAGFWPYVLGPMAQGDAAQSARYSALMQDSQALVAADTLRLVDLSDRHHLMDVGGGTGAFLQAVALRYPALRLTLFDLPEVLAGSHLAARIPGLSLRPGSFRSDPLPDGADSISLLRVLYDHPDSLVAHLLSAAHAALPPGGRILVSEPMSGGSRPDAATDVYFAVYTLAMGTGRTRSAAEIGQALGKAGFTMIQPRPGPRRFITSVVEARRG